MQSITLTPARPAAIFRPMAKVRFIQWLHWAILIFVLTAWLWPWATALWAHAIFVPLMLLHWKTNENRCVLSELETKFKSPEGGAIARAEESQFIKTVWSSVFGTHPPERVMDKINYIACGVVWTITVLRLSL